MEGQALGLDLFDMFPDDVPGEHGDEIPDDGSDEDRMPARTSPRKCLPTKMRLTETRVAQRMVTL